MEYALGLTGFALFFGLLLYIARQRIRESEGGIFYTPYSEDSLPDASDQPYEYGCMMLADGTTRPIIPERMRAVKDECKKNQ